MSARTVTVMPLGGQQAKGPGSYVDFVLPMGTLIPSSISVSGYLTTQIVDANNNFAAGDAARHRRIHAVRPSIPESLINRVQVFAGNQMVTDTQNWNQYINLQRDLTNNFNGLAHSAAYVSNTQPYLDSAQLEPSAITANRSLMYLTDDVNSGTLQTETNAYINFTRFPGLLECGDAVDTTKVGRIRVRLWFESVEALLTTTITKYKYQNTANGALFAHLPYDLALADAVTAGEGVGPYTWTRRNSALTRNYFIDNLRLFVNLLEGPGEDNVSFTNIYNSLIATTGNNITTQVNLPGSQIKEIAILPQPVYTTNRYTPLTDRQSLFYRSSPAAAVYTIMLNNKTIIQGLNSLDIINSDTKVADQINTAHKLAGGPASTQGFAIIKSFDDEPADPFSTLDIRAYNSTGIANLLVFSKNTCVLTPTNVIS